MFIDIGNDTLLDTERVEALIVKDNDVIITTSNNTYTSSLSLQALMDLIHFGKEKEEEKSEPKLEKQVEEIGNVVKTIGTFAG